MTPIDELLDEICELEKLSADDLRKRQQHELEMWNTWQQNGHKKKHLRPLLRSLKPFINHKANAYAHRLRDIPPAAVRAEFTNQAVEALKKFDPNRGTKLTTYLTPQLKKAQRYVATYQNMARIPETRVYKIGELQNAEAALDEELGRAPTQLELADRLKWSPRLVGTLQKELVRDYPTGMNDSGTFTPSRQDEVMRLLPYELTNEERSVFEYIYGVGGKPKLGPGAIARKLGMSAPKVSRLKKAIAQKYARYAK